MVNGLRYSYPTRETCVADGGLPVPEDHFSDLLPEETMPITAPPTVALHHPSWSEIVTAAARETDSSTYRARDEMDGLALTLFNAAFTADRPEPNARTEWGSFVALLNGSAATTPITTCLVLLSHQDVWSSDRALFFDLITAPPGAERQRLAEAIGGRVRQLLGQSNAAFNGWRSSTSLSGEDRVLLALAGLLGPTDYEATLGAIVGPELSSLLVHYDRQELDQLMGLPEDDLLQLYVVTLGRVRALPIGSAPRLIAGERLADLDLICLSRGISLEQLHFDLFVEGLPGLEEADYQALYQLGISADSPEHSDNLAYRDEFFRQFVGFSERLLTADQGSAERTALSGAVFQLYMIGRQFGYSYQALDAIFERTAGRLEVNLEPSGSVPDLFTLSGEEQFIVGPAGLPAEVLYLLDEGGMLGLVMNNIREIVLTPEINEGYSLTGLDAGGRASYSTRSVEIDYLSQEGEIIPAWQIAQILVHEAAHIAWGRNVRPALQDPIPNERQAFLADVDFLAGYLERALADGSVAAGSNEEEEIRLLITADRLAARAANLVLGYPEDDLDPYRFDLPTGELLRSRGLAQVSDLDLSAYPADQAGVYALDNYDELIDSLSLPAERREEVRDLFSRIIWSDQVVVGRFAGAPAGSDLALLAEGYSAIRRAMGQPATLPVEEVLVGSDLLLGVLTSLYIYQQACAAE